MTDRLAWVDTGGNANATVTTGTGFRSSILAGQEPAGAPLREAQRITAVAPMTSNRRMSRCPIFEVFPSFCLPPHLTEWIKTTSYRLFTKRQQLQRISAEENAFRPLGATAGEQPVLHYSRKQQQNQALAAAVSSCHMMTFLALAAKAGWPVASYQDHAVAHLGKNPRGQMSVTQIDLYPVVKFDPGFTVEPEKLEEVHRRAHRYCFISNTLADSVETKIH